MRGTGAERVLQRAERCLKKRAKNCAVETKVRFLDQSGRLEWTQLRATGWERVSAAGGRSCRKLLTMRRKWAKKATLNKQIGRRRPKPQAQPIKALWQATSICNVETRTLVIFRRNASTLRADMQRISGEMTALSSSLRTTRIGKIQLKVLSAFVADKREIQTLSGREQLPQFGSRAARTSAATTRASHRSLSFRETKKHASDDLDGGRHRHQGHIVHVSPLLSEILGGGLPANPRKLFF